VVDLARRVELAPDTPVEEWARAGADAMLDAIRRTLARFRVDFDSWFRERSLYEEGLVESAIERAR
jgi:arginyl-tRNA synthetase